MAARSLPEMAEYRQKMKFTICFLFHARSSRTNQLTAPRAPGVLLYVLLHCCNAVCRKGLVGGWVSVGCTASSVVGGWAGPYVGVFFRPVGDDLFFFGF